MAKAKINVSMIKVGSRVSLILFWVSQVRLAGAGKWL